MAGDRDVKIRLTVEGGSDAGAKGLKATADAARDAANQVKALNAEQQKVRAAAASNPAAPRAGLAGGIGGGADPFAGVKQIEAQRQAMLQRPGLPTAAPYQPPPPSLRAAEQAKKPDEVKAPPAAKQEAAGGLQAGIGKALAQQAGIPPEALAALGASVASIVGAVKVLSAGLSTAAKAVDAYGDATLTASQKVRRIAESIPVLGEVYKSAGELADALSGKTEAIRKATREEAQVTATAQAGAQAFQASAPVRQQIAALDAKAAAFEKLPAAFNAAAAPSRDTFEGNVAFQQFERAQPLEFEKAKAAAEVAAAQQAEADARRRRLDQQSNVGAAASRSDAAKEAEKEALAAEREAKRPGRARGALGDLFGDKAVNTAFTAAIPFKGLFESADADKNKINASSELKKKLAEELAERQKLIAAAQQEAAAVQTTQAAEAKFRQANIALAKEKLAVLKEEEQRIAGAAASFGSLSAVDKQAALEAAQQLKGRGYDSLTPEQKQAISAAGFGQQLNFAAQQSALADPFFQQISQLFGQSADLKGNQQKQLDLQAQIGVDVKVDEQKLANQLRDALKPVLEELVKQLEAIAKAQADQVKVGQNQANAAQ